MTKKRRNCSGNTVKAVQYGLAHHIVIKRGGRNHAGDIDPIHHGRQET